MNSTQQLTAARQRESAALQDLQRAEAKLAGIRAEHQSYLRARDDAQRQLDEIRPGFAAAAGDVLRDTELELAASQRQLEAAQRDVEAAKQRLAAARAAVKAAVLAVERAQTIRPRFEAYKAHFDAVMKERDCLLGLAMVDPGALTDSEWGDVDARVLSAEEMQIGLPITAMRDVDWRPRRTVINTYADLFRERLARLERGEEPSEAAA